MREEAQVGEGKGGRTMQGLSQMQQVLPAPLVTPQLPEKTLEVLSEGKQTASVVKRKIDEFKYLVFGEISKSEKRRARDATQNALDLQ
jgi:hypothetical protein